MGVRGNYEEIGCAKTSARPHSVFRVATGRPFILRAQINHLHLARHLEQLCIRIGQRNVRYFKVLKSPRADPAAG
jgi:hypothetical protein